ncbi:MAG: hypothetical protein ACFB10_18745 [Salibacteraceae bacterium]
MVGRYSQLNDKNFSFRFLLILEFQRFALVAWARERWITFQTKSQIFCKGLMLSEIFCRFRGLDKPTGARAFLLKGGKSFGQSKEDVHLCRPIFGLIKTVLATNQLS